MLVNSKFSSMFNKALWAIGTYGASLSLKLGSNVIFSRLLAPEILGIMVVINSIRYGVELLTDVGIEQNIVSNKKGLEESFFNTAWTLQIIRGAFLTALFLSLTPTFSSFYGIDRRIFLLISFAPFLNSLASTSIFVLVRNIDVKKRNLFELSVEVCGFFATIILVLVSPSAYALVIGILLLLAIRSGLSYFIAHPSHRLILNRSYVLEIVGFGKWIVISSLIIYASTNLDRIYLGKVASLSILGVYGLARTIAELPPMLAGRLSYQLIFPVIAAAEGENGPVHRTQLATTRQYFVIAASVVMATLVAWSDFAIDLLYDKRYAAAGWMLCVLLCGSWVSVLSNLNEAILLGLGKPMYISISNASRLFLLAVGLPVGYQVFGLPGAVVFISISEAARYLSVVIGQQKSGYSFWRQDITSTILFLSILSCWILLRYQLKLGVPWNGIVYS